MTSLGRLTHGALNMRLHPPTVRPARSPLTALFATIEPLDSLMHLRAGSTGKSTFFSLLLSGYCRRKDYLCAVFVSFSSVDPCKNCAKFDAEAFRKRRRLFRSSGRILPETMNFGGPSSSTMIFS